MSPVGKSSGSLTAGLKPPLHWTEVWKKFPVLHSTPIHPRHPLLFTYKANGILTPGFWKRNSKCYTVENATNVSKTDLASRTSQTIAQRLFADYRCPKSPESFPFSFVASKPLDIFLLGGGEKARELSCCQENRYHFFQAGFLSWDPISLCSRGYRDQFSNLGFLRF